MERGGRRWLGLRLSLLTLSAFLAPLLLSMLCWMQVEILCHTYFPLQRPLKSSNVLNTITNRQALLLYRPFYTIAPVITSRRDPVRSPECIELRIPDSSIRPRLAHRLPLDTADDRVSSIAPASNQETVNTLFAFPYIDTCSTEELSSMKSNTRGSLFEIDFSGEWVTCHE